MTRRQAVTTLGVATAGIATAAFAQNSNPSQRPAGSAGATADAGATGPWDACARTLSNCAMSCARTSNHCTQLAEQGKVEHVRMARMTAECASVCAGMSIKCAAQSATTQHLLEACAAICDECAAQCEKMNDEIHKRCAETCRRCARECRDLKKSTDA